MSGIKRAILAEIAADGKTSLEEVNAAFSPENMRKETGRSNMNGNLVTNEDKGKYTGKNAEDNTK